MSQQSVADKPKTYAEKALRAEKYVQDYHLFKMFACDTCGPVPMTLEIEPHTGSKRQDFKGIIRGTCSQCGVTKQVFSFTGGHRRKIRVERPHCTCGNDTFYVGECERIEGDEGVFGFFDEGVVVGQCAVCGKDQIFFFTD